MKVPKYKVLHGDSWAKAGEIVYGLMLPDYGCAGDDSRNTGIEHISVTRKEDGGYPSFTFIVDNLEELDN